MLVTFQAFHGAGNQASCGAVVRNCKAAGKQADKDSLLGDLLFSLCFAATFLIS